MAADYYATLGLSKNASPEEIKRAYRRLAHQHHPDKSKGSTEKFKQVNEAYQILSDPNKRKQYDQFGTTFNNTGRPGPGFDFEDIFRGFSAGGGSAFGGEDAFDIFSDIFGQGQRTQSRRTHGVDLEMGLSLTFEEAVFGKELEISLEKKDTCEHCKGTGAEPGSKISSCPKCHGVGQIKTNRRSIFGTIQTVTTCDECGGEGKVAEQICRECAGSGVKRRIKKLVVRIPAGVEDGMRVRMPNEGEAGYRGSDFGDLYLKLKVLPHSSFKREGVNILSEMPISFYQATLGTGVETITLDGKVLLKVPAGTQSGRVFRLKGKGVPVLNGSGRGDQLVTVRVVTPTKLTKKEKELFKKIAEEKGESVGSDESLWSKFTS